METRSPTGGNRDEATAVPTGRPAVRAALWGLLVVQAVVVAWALRPWTTPDTADYVRMAEGLTRGVFGQLRDGVIVPEAVRPPGYALLLVLLRHLLHLPVVAVVALQMAGWLGSVWLVERLLRVRQLPSWPLLAVLLVYPAGAAYAAIVGTEAPTIVAVALAAWLVAGTRRFGLREAVGLGAVAGAALLVRPNFVLFPLLVAGLAFLRTKREGDAVDGEPAGGRDPWKRAAVVLASAAVVVAPYAVRNAVVFSWPLPLPPATPAGTSLHLATWQELFEQEDVDAFYRGTVTPRMREIGFDTAVARINREMGLPPLSPPFTPTSYVQPEVQLQVTRTYRAEALRRIAREPAPYVLHVLRNVWQMWNVQAYPAALSPWGSTALAVISGLVWALGLGTAVAVFVLPAPFWLRTSGAVVLYFLVLQVGLHTEARYTAPARLFLVLNAVWALPWLLGRLPAAPPAATAEEA